MCACACACLYTCVGHTENKCQYKRHSLLCGGAHNITHSYYTYKPTIDRDDTDDFISKSLILNYEKILARGPLSFPHCVHNAKFQPPCAISNEMRCEISYCITNRHGITALTRVWPACPSFAYIIFIYNFRTYRSAARNNYMWNSTRHETGVRILWMRSHFSLVEIFV